jgi:predicted CXXCH cytochrome family protein
MKSRRMIMGAFVVAVLPALILLPASRPFAGSIVGTPHDLSGMGWGTNEICIFCHTPHNAKTPQLAPLWNHASTTATYTLYSSPTMDVPVGQPGDASKFCLSCHDGTVAIDSYGSRTGTNFMPGTPGVPGSKNLGTDLSDDHPVGIEFLHQTVFPTPYCPTCHNFSGSPPPPTGIELRFYNRKVECGSCHNPHSNTLTKFLRKTVTGSAICRHCHQNK